MRASRPDLPRVELGADVWDEDPPARSTPADATPPLGEQHPTLELEDDPSERRRVVPAAGALIDGAYRVISTLGEGATGAVLLAHDERLDRRVAIKVIRPRFVGGAVSVQRLLAEARAVARVHHPNVVQVHALGEADGVPYLVMEYVPGPTLETWLRIHASAEPLPIDLALGVLDQICRGVEAIHRVRTVHRDLKPGNVLVGPAFRVVVTDFGLARPSGQPQNPRAGFVSGTPAYLAPELGTPDPPDPALASRADVYALGVMAYELLVGRLPFVASTIPQMLHLHAHEPPPLPSEVRPGLSRDFDAPLRAALAKSPAMRTESAEALRLALQAARDRGRTVGPRRALVADDDPGYRSLLTRIIARTFPGCVVESVPDGSAALASMDSCRPDLAVLDLDMPGLSGIELTALVRSRPYGERVPILIATGVTSASDWELLQRLGVEGILVKPFDPAQLATLARAVLHPRPGR